MSGAKRRRRGGAVPGGPQAATPRSGKIFRQAWLKKSPEPGEGSAPPRGSIHRMVDVRPCRPAIQPTSKFSLATAPGLYQSLTSPATFHRFRLCLKTP